MTWRELAEGIRSDLYRHQGAGVARIVKIYLISRSFKITFWFRLAQFCMQNRAFLPGLLVRFKYRLICNRYCVDFPVRARVGKGLIIYHCFGLVVHQDSIIGDNVMLAHQVTLATEKGGTPVIGDRVRIAPGAKIVGKVQIGNGSVIGANAVVIKDVPETSVAVGVPARVLNRPFEEFVERYYWPPAGEAAVSPIRPL